MVDAEAGTSLVAHVDTLARCHGAVPRGRPIAATFRAKAAAGQQPLESWWHPAEHPAPQPEPVLAAHLANGTAAAPAASSTAGTGRPSVLFPPPVQGSRPAAAPRQQPGATPSRPPLLPSSMWRPLLVVAALGAAWRVPLAGIMLAAALAGAIALYRWWRLRG
jgi:hypothetical protein